MLTVHAPAHVHVPVHVPEADEQDALLRISTERILSLHICHVDPGLEENSIYGIILLVCLRVKEVINDHCSTGKTET